MLQIKKLRPDHVLDFAAEELKKYLRMMMPACGEIGISYEPEAKEGFRLGLLEDFGLPSEAEDPYLDDVIHVDTSEEGGILAGSNPRSVLFAVYRFLRENGCRWLYPGIDGEYVSIRDIGPTQYHKMADHRFRGHCNEGAESQTCMLETIDFYAKQELNVYMLEFAIPYSYYRKYYDHRYNEKYRPPEPVSHDQVLQWKRQCESEISKRGLMFHDMGHGWTAEPFGISSVTGWEKTGDDLTEEQRSVLAQVDGVRDFYKGVPLNTNLCMSDPKVRTTMAKAIADYAENQRNVSYLHVWLADSQRNHCECEACQKMRPSDFYMMIMNEVDEELSARNLDTRIVFIAYVDTLFAPRAVDIRNPGRFSLLYAPITRTYSASIRANSVIPEPPEYQRNRWKTPCSAEENMAFLKDWQRRWKGPCFSYEYHFWMHQYFDLGGLYLARRIYEDIRALRYMGLDGFVEDGSQRSFFPNGFAIYIYAEALMNRECDFEEVAKDYFSHVYGACWQEVMDVLKNIGDTFDFSFVSGERSKDLAISIHYDPEQAERLEAVYEYCARERAIAKEHLAMPTRPQTVSMRLLLRHAEYCEELAKAFQLKARGRNQQAEEKALGFYKDFGKYELEIERYYDHALAATSVIRKLRDGRKMITL